jgi:hypothetical protein
MNNRYPKDNKININEIPHIIVIIPKDYNIIPMDIQFKLLQKNIYTETKNAFTEYKERIEEILDKDDDFCGVLDLGYVIQKNKKN